MDYFACDLDFVVEKINSQKMEHFERGIGNM